VVFLAIGAFAAVVGAHDAFSSIEVASRFGGLLLLLAGLSLIAVAIFLLATGISWAPTAGILISPVATIVGLSFVSAQLLSVDREWSLVLIAIGIGAVVLVAGIYLHWGAWRLSLLATLALGTAYLSFVHGDHDQRLFLWAAIVIFSGLACFALWRAEPPSMSISAPRVLGGIFGFFTLSALIGGAQLWYTSQYLPSSLGASLSVESHLTRVGTQGKSEVARLTLSIQNTAQVQAKILGSLYRVTAAPLKEIRLTDRQMREELERAEAHDRPVSRFRRSFSWDLVQAGRIFSDRAWLDPGERYTTSALVYIPRGRYDTLRSKAVVLMAKGKALALDDSRKYEVPQIEPTRTVRRVASVWPIEETSWFRQLTHSDRVLQVMWITSRRGNTEAARFPHLGFAAFRVGSDDNVDEFASYNEQLLSTYGLGEALSSTETVLGGSGR